jgi:ATP-binding cassette subfamily C protein PrsD
MSMQAVQSEEAAGLWRRYRRAVTVVAILSAVLNVLLLAGSLYLMLVYDSVLPSHSIPTLFGLLAMLVGVYLFQSFFDTMRTRILTDVGADIDRQLSPRVQQAIGEAARRGGASHGDGLTAVRDLDAVRFFLGGSGPGTLIDVPWGALFLLVLFLLHPWLGVTALVGALVLIGLTIMTDRATAKPTLEVGQIASRRNALAETNLRHVEMLSALGMAARMRARWGEVNARYIAAQTQLSHSVGRLSGISRVFRLFLQSAILTVGALLVIDGKASAGVIFASSIISGRALAPIDQAIANWRAFAAARSGWRRLNVLLARVPAPRDVAVDLPRPRAVLAVEQLAVAPPGSQRLTVQGIDFRLEAGQALGVIGPSAAGKSSLARAIVGAWVPARGTVRLDGADLAQWDAEALGASIGYLPQAVELLDGTIAQNIARFTPDAASEAIIAAAQAAGVHDMIVALPGGYDLPVGVDGGQLSAGQRQRIGLARALFGAPFLVVLDEPNSNLDVAGEEALTRAIAGVRAGGGIAIVIAHRPASLAPVSHALFLRDGRMEAFGPRDEVLGKVLQRRPAPGTGPQPVPSAGAR